MLQQRKSHPKGGGFSSYPLNFCKERSADLFQKDSFKNHSEEFAQENTFKNRFKNYLTRNTRLILTHYLVKIVLRIT